MKDKPAMIEIVKNRHEIVFFIEAKNTNYNGDPDMENIPRVDYETGLGYMTDVSIKSRVRRYIQDTVNKPGYEIFVKDKANLNKAIAECAVKAASGDENSKKSHSVDDASTAARERFYDVRAFGGVLTTGANAGQIQGPIQISMPLSKDPVQTIDATITRCSYADGKSLDMEEYDKIEAKTPDDKKRTMGKKAFASYALFEVHVFVSANLAGKSGFTEEDLSLFMEAIMNMYNYQTSSSKAGMSVVGPMIVFKHVGTINNNTEEQRAREALLGCCSAQKLFALIDVHKKENVEYPREYTDYEASVSVTKLPAGVKIGFKQNPYRAVEWVENYGEIPKDIEWLNVI